MKAKGLSLLLLFVTCAMLLACAQTDAGLTTKVKSKLAADDVVKAHEINVDTQEGVVTLTGNVDTEDAKQRAIQLARETEGVKDVQDMISVQMAGGGGDAPDMDRSAEVAVDDAGITMKVKTNLLADELAKGLGIDVDTRGGVVYLTGKVNSEEQKEAVVRVARATEGVKDVQPNLTVEVK